jgi:hypothetical protein
VSIRNFCQSEYSRSVNYNFGSISKMKRKNCTQKRAQNKTAGNNFRIKKVIFLIVSVVKVHENTCKAAIACKNNESACNGPEGACEGREIVS